MKAFFNFRGENITFTHKFIEQLQTLSYVDEINDLSVRFQWSADERDLEIVTIETDNEQAIRRAQELYKNLDY